MFSPKLFREDARFFSAVFHLRQIGGKIAIFKTSSVDDFFKLPENSTTGTTLANNDVHDDDMSNIYDSPKVPPIPVVMNSAVVSVSELQKNRQIAAAELPTNQPHHDNNNCNTKSLYISRALSSL